MPLYKAIVTIPLDSGLPADSAQMTPWFNDHGVGTDPANLAGQICDVFMKPSTGWISAAGEITTAMYPSATVMAAALQLATALSGVGGVDVDWVVHSHANDASYTVTNAWVDDEWDTQRRRGMRPTTRQLAAVSG